MTDVTIYKPSSVTIRLVNGQYVVIKPAGMTIQALNRPPPLDQTALVVVLTAQVAQLTQELADCRGAGLQPPTITNLTALPSSLPVGGGVVVVDAMVVGADNLVLTLDGANVPLPSGLPVTVSVT